MRYRVNYAIFLLLFCLVAVSDAQVDEFELSDDMEFGDDEFPPDLSPNTFELIFQGLLPGESKTLFMDLVNLGEEIIEIANPISPTPDLSVSLISQNLAQGQFVRFPVTYIQKSLQTESFTLLIPWKTSNAVDTLSIVIWISPKLPLEIMPRKLSSARAYLGQPEEILFQLINRGRSAIYFNAPPIMPEGVWLEHVPQLIVGGRTASVSAWWLPTTEPMLSGEIVLPFTVGDVNGSIHMEISGQADPALAIEPDSIVIALAFTGSGYLNRVRIKNRSNRMISLIRQLGEVTAAESAGGLSTVSAALMLESPSELILGPGEVGYLDVRFLPNAGMHFDAELNYNQIAAPTLGRAADALPNVRIPIHAEVLEPLTIRESQLDFGAIPVQSTTSQPLSLINRGKVEASLNIELVGQQPEFSFPPLEFVVPPGRSLFVPVFFKPMNVADADDTLRVEYTAGGYVFELFVPIGGSGLDLPLLVTKPIPDFETVEDEDGWQLIARLNEHFDDPNNPITFRLDHGFGSMVKMIIKDDSRLMAELTPNFYGSGDVVVQAVNAIGHMVADTFRFEIEAVNDLPIVAERLQDLVLMEDPQPIVVGRLSHIFIDPDRILDTVVTKYSIYNLSGDAGIQLRKNGDELVLEVAKDWSGDANFVVSAQDMNDTNVVVYDDIRVTVLPVNDAPILAALPNPILSEDDTLHMDWSSFIHDIDNDFSELSLSFTAVNGSRLPLRFIPNGEMQTIIEPILDWAGEVEVSLEVDDGAGGTAVGQFKVSVLPINDPPTAFSAIGPFSESEEDVLVVAGVDTLLTFTWSRSRNRDRGDILSYTWVLLDAKKEHVYKQLPAGNSRLMRANIDSSGLYWWTVEVRDSFGAMAHSDTLPLQIKTLARPEQGDESELAFQFGPNYPNPFSARTKIEYTIPGFTQVQISIYNAMGHKVRRLFSGTRTQGDFVASWDGRDDKGQRVASGPYVAEIKAGIHSAFLKLLVVR